MTLAGMTMVMTTSPFQVLFHLADTSIPTNGGGVVSGLLEQADLAIVPEMTKQKHIISQVHFMFRLLDVR